MNQKLHHLFKNISELEPSPKLEMIILQRIKIEKAEKMKRKLLWTYAGLLGSAMVAICTIFTFGNAFLRSEFWSVINLAFSDWQIVADYWSDFLYSLLETLPVIPLVVIIAPIALLFWSINSYINLNRSNRHKYI